MVRIGILLYLYTAILFNIKNQSFITSMIAFLLEAVYQVLFTERHKLPGVYPRGFPSKEMNVFLE